MSSEENRAIARRFVQEHNQSQYLATFDQLLAPNSIVHEYLPGLPDSMDRDAFTHFIAMFRSAIPDIHDTIEDAVAEGDKVVVRWKGYGKHTGADLIGVPAGNKQVTANGSIFSVLPKGRL